jgi:hypothetical protein
MKFPLFVSVRFCTPANNSLSLHLCMRHPFFYKAFANPLPGRHLRVHGGRNGGIARSGVGVQYDLHPAEFER